MNITREEAIRKHREMWNWIAEQYECGHGTTVHILKKNFIKKYYPGDNPYANCYCCECSTEISEIDGKSLSLKCNCDMCPLEWPSDYHDLMCCYKRRNYKEEIHGLYKQILYYSSQVMDYKKAATIAREIAKLPERKIEEE